MNLKRRMVIMLFVLVMVVSMFSFTFGVDAKVEKIRVGYLHTVAVDAQFWLMLNKLKTFEKVGFEVEPIMFTSGIPLMQALAGGSVDVAIMGAVISNFPAQGVGKVFLINSIEFDTAKLFARPETSAQGIANVKGETVATVKGTTAHVFFYNACKSVGLNSEKDVELVNMDMASAVAAFIKGAVKYVVTWCPFDTYIKERVPDVILLSSAKDFYPDAAIIGGWVATEKTYKRPDIMQKIIEAWVPANDYLVKNPDEALEWIQKNAYPDIPLTDIKDSYFASLCHTSDEWVKLYQDGTVQKWIGQVEQVYVDIGAFKEFKEPTEFWDPSLYIYTLKHTLEY